MLFVMIDWLQNPHANYVVGAYGVALVALLGFALASWRAARVQDRKWLKLQQGRSERAS
jgi:heme exporter protein CcmD